MRKVEVLALYYLLIAGLVQASNRAVFNYGYKNEDKPGGGTSYGQEDWGDVSCDDLSTCVSDGSSFCIAILVQATSTFV